jgi:hypothetical protein
VGGTSGGGSARRRSYLNELSMRSTAEMSLPPLPGPVAPRSLPSCLLALVCGEDLGGVPVTISVDIDEVEDDVHFLQLIGRQQSPRSTTLALQAAPALPRP